MGPVEYEYNEDSDMSFVPGLPTVSTYYNGDFRVHDENASRIIIEGKRWVPMISICIQRPGRSMECNLYARQEDGDFDFERPVVACFLSGLSLSKECAVFSVLALFTFATAVGSQAILLLVQP